MEKGNLTQRHEPSIMDKARGDSKYVRTIYPVIRS